MSRKTLLFAILIVIIGATLVLGNYYYVEKGNAPASKQQTNQYRRVEFINAPWGSSKGEVGLLHGPAHDYGPQSFYIDAKSNLYLLDSVNQRILVYDQQGLYLSMFSLTERVDSLIDIIVCDDRIYVLDTAIGQVLEYNMRGQFADVHEIPGEIAQSAIIKGIDIDINGNLMVESNDHKFYQIKPKDSHQYKYQGKQSNNGREYYIIKSEATNGVIEVLERAGTVIREMTISDLGFLGIFSLNDGSVYYENLNLDSAGNIYVQVTIHRKRLADKLDIWKAIGKYSPEGELLAVIPVSDPDVGELSLLYPHKEMMVNTQGNIYYLLTLPDHVRIVKFQISEM